MTTRAKKKPVSRVETITPEMASEYLERNTHNRPLRQRRVDQLVAAIQRGEWILNGDAIRFDSNGVLADGQHRLWAIFSSGVACESLVVEGLDEEAQHTMDTGARRTLKDTLQLKGHNSPQVLAAAINYLWKMEQNRVRENSVKPTIAQALALLDLNPALPDSVPVANRFNDRFRGSTGMIASLHYTFATIDSELADSFFTTLIKGTNLNDKDPIYLLRSILERQVAAGPGSRSQAVVTHALIVKAWNAWVNGEQLQRLTWKAAGSHAEAVPEPVSPPS